MHELVAHLAAGAKETTDLIEESLTGRPPRTTRSFDEREAAFVALPDEQLRRAMVDESHRKAAATEALATGCSTFPACRHTEPAWRRPTSRAGNHE